MRPYRTVCGSADTEEAPRARPPPCYVAKRSDTRCHPRHGKMTNQKEAAESIEARLAKLERQTEWVAIELAQVRSALESMVSIASEALLSEPEV